MSNPPFFLNECRSLSIAACCAADKGRSSALNFLRFRLSISTAGRLAPDCASSMASEAIVEGLPNAMKFQGSQRSTGLFFKSREGDNRYRGRAEQRYAVLGNCLHLICFDLAPGPVRLRPPTTPHRLRPADLHRRLCSLSTFTSSSRNSPVYFNRSHPPPANPRSWSTKCSSGAASVRVIPLKTLRYPPQLCSRG